MDGTCPLPALEDDEVLVRVKCVGINPVDVKVLDTAPHAGSTIGCEFAGDVVKVGPLALRKRKDERLKVGAAVFGCICGDDPKRPDNGAFAEYVAVPGDLVYLLPPHMSYQQGATLGAALPTVGMAIYNLWHLPLPYAAPPVPAAPGGGGSPKYVLVYGGSTVSGAMAIQMLRLSGFVPVCTCSPQNFSMVKALGAEEAFDYHSPGCGDEIRRYTAHAPVAYALDCITDVSTMRHCYAALGPGGGRYMGLNPIPIRAHTRRDVKADYILVYTMFGKALDWPRPFARPARPRDRAFADEWYRGTQTLLDNPSGVLRPHPVDAGGGGLEGVLEGLDRMRKGDVHGVKLVYDLYDLYDL